MSLKTPNRIIIIHPSLIIREGLSSLVKRLFDLDPIALSDSEELADYMDMKDQKLIFLVDAQVDHEHFRTKAEQYKIGNEVKVILIREPDAPSDCEDNCNCCFPTDVDKDRFQQLLKPYLEKVAHTNKSNNSGLTDREVDVVKLVAFGKTNKEIADELYISIHTVISHRKNITEKLGIKSISGLTVYAILNNLIDAKTIDPESLI